MIVPDKTGTDVGFRLGWHVLGNMNSETGGHCPDVVGKRNTCRCCAGASKIWVCIINVYLVGEVVEFL